MILRKREMPFRLKKRLFSTLLGCLLLAHSSSAHAEQWIQSYSTAPFIGPEIYHVKRVKEGGAEQTGTLYGGRIGYDHIRRYKLYWGIDALWAKGTLTGHVENEQLKSAFTDINAEARIGFTFQSQWHCLSFTPYSGLGYFWEKNHYQHPSPLQLHFDNTFSYVPVGFLSQIFLTPSWSLGLNVKVRVILEGKQKVTHDPNYGKLTQQYQDKLQYRIELPITYFFCWDSHPLGIGFIPFFDYRHYGHRANFPFDFLDTKLYLYGATLKLLYLF